MRVSMTRSDLCRLLRCNENAEQRSSASEILSRLQQISLPGGNIRPFASDDHAAPHTDAAQHDLKCVSRFIDTFCASGSNSKYCTSVPGNRESHVFEIGERNSRDKPNRCVYIRDTEGQKAPWLFRLDPAAAVRRPLPPFVNCIAS